MTDKELIELAAKATGAKYYADRDWPGLCLSGELDIIPFYVNSRGSGAIEWNPLTDDGDALRLAVKLCLVVGIDGEEFQTTVDYTSNYEDRYVIEGHGLDASAATRRAITRAAAQIGKEME